MLIHSEKAISLWKTVHLASVLSNTSHLRFWQLSAWLCAWFLILVKEKWKFKALQELLLMVECESSQGPGISWVPRTLILQPSRHAGCPGLWQTARLLKGQHSTLLLSCQARCLWAVQWQGDRNLWFPALVQETKGWQAAQLGGNLASDTLNLYPALCEGAESMGWCSNPIRSNTYHVWLNGRGPFLTLFFFLYRFCFVELSTHFFLPCCSF